MFHQLTATTLVLHESYLITLIIAFTFVSTLNCNVDKQPTETLIEAFTRLDGEILALENLSPGSRLTTAEAWVEHLEVR
jgi:hypothetical protein